jgi:hypothetical protein
MLSGHTKPFSFTAERRLFSATSTGPGNPYDTHVLRNVIGRAQEDQ